jgi:hypothetical protein
MSADKQLDEVATCLRGRWTARAAWQAARARAAPPAARRAAPAILILDPPTKFALFPKRQTYNSLSMAIGTKSYSPSPKGPIASVQPSVDMTQ